MPRPPKPTKLIHSKLSINYSDCRECANYQGYGRGLIDCKKSIIPVENCLNRKIKCINFKIK